VIPNAFDLHRPTSLDEALELLASEGEGAKVLAGGQSLIPLMKLRLASPRALVDLARVPGLVGIAENGGSGSTGQLTIGAMTPYFQLEESDLVGRACPLLRQTAAVVADVQVRHRGTVGGSLAHADPTSDMAAAALALDAEVRVVARRGERWVRVEDLITGFYSTDLAQDEILTEVRVPSLVGWSSAYLKAAKKQAGFAIAGVAVCVRQAADGTCEDIRVGVTGVTDRPIRARNVEDALRGQRLSDEAVDAAAASVVDRLWIADDFRASSSYREHMARVCTARAIRAARDRTGDNG
jgi:carbon-monoxide dehydrogenase medium subunit